MDRMLRVDQLSKSYGQTCVLDQVSFDVRPKEILGLIGPNGSGKTTLIGCMAAQLPADGGEVRWQEAPLPPQRRKAVMFYLPEQATPWPDHWVGDILNFFANAYRIEHRLVAGIVRRLDLMAVLNKRFSELSKGYRRRCLLAVGFLSPQPLLVLDEPFDGLDLRQTLSVMELLREVVRSGRTLFLSIHQLTDAQRVCDRFLLLHAGRLIGVGTLDELRAQARLPAGNLEDVFLALT